MAWSAEEQKRLEDRLASARTDTERKRRTQELADYKAKNPQSAATTAPAGTTPTATTTPAAPALSERDQAIANLVGPGAQGATALSENLFAPGSLGRVSTGFDASGNRIAETQDALNRAKGAALKYSGAAVDAQGNPISRRSADVTATVDAARAGLGGYSAAEQQGMKEQALAGANQAQATNMRELAKMRARSGGRMGGGQERIMARDNAAIRSNVSRDISVKNADEKQKRLGEFGGLVRGVEGEEYNKMQDSNKTYSDLLAKTRADELERGKFNIEQVGAEKAGQFGSYFGGLNLGLANKQFDEGKRYNDEILAIAKKKYKV